MENLVKITKSELVIMAQLRKPKEKNIGLSGLTEGTNIDVKENEADDSIKKCDLITQINITNPDEIIDTVYRRGNRTGGVRQLIVEFNNPDNRKFLLKHSNLYYKRFNFKIPERQCLLLILKRNLRNLRS